VNTFPVSIAVQPGDLVGLNNENATTVNNACLFATGNSADAFGASASYGDAGDGTTESMNPVTSQLKLNVTATVAAVPTVSSVAPSSGSTTGGTSVTVAGRDFTGTTAVNFGAARARSFTVNSDGTINAVSPAASAGTVDVTVTTAVGTSPATAADRFTFVKPVKCVVPKLKGKTLKAARKALKKAHCKLGKIKGPKGKKARIKKQKPKAGTVLASGSKVRVTTKKRK
jgi:hypothetical protein